MIDFFAPSIWKNTMYSDRAAWDSVRNEKIAQETAGDLNKYSSSFPEQVFYGLYDSLADLSETPAEGLEVEHELMRKSLELPEFKTLRNEVSDDELASLLGMQEFSSNLINKLPDEVKKDMEDNQKAQDDLKNLVNQAQQQKGGNQPDPQLQKKIANAQKKASQAAQNALNSMDKNKNQVANSLATSMKKASKDIKDSKDTMNMLGCGSENGKLSHEDLENAQKLSKILSDNKRLKKIIDLIGAMNSVVDSETKKSMSGHEQLVDYQRKELDLENLAPEEWLGLGSPEGSALKIDFDMRMADNDVLHCQYDGEAPLGKGPMIVLKDTSGSMMGDRMELANALDFAIMRQMMKDHRRFISIPFSAGDDWHMFEPGEHPDMKEILDHLSISYGGGTDPYPPLNAAVDKILESTNFKKAGILIITDGEFQEPPKELLDKIQKAKGNPGLQISAIVIGSAGGSIETFSDKVVEIGELMYHNNSRNYDINYAASDEKVNAGISKALQGMF